MKKLIMFFCFSAVTLLAMSGEKNDVVSDEVGIKNLNETVSENFKPSFNISKSQACKDDCMSFLKDTNATKDNK